VESNETLITHLIMNSLPAPAFGASKFEIEWTEKCVRGVVVMSTCEGI